MGTASGEHWDSTRQDKISYSTEGNWGENLHICKKWLQFSLKKLKTIKNIPYVVDISYIPIHFSNLMEIQQTDPDIGLKKELSISTINPGENQ